MSNRKCKGREHAAKPEAIKLSAVNPFRIQEMQQQRRLKTKKEEIGAANKSKVNETMGQKIAIKRSYIYCELIVTRNRHVAQIQTYFLNISNISKNRNSLS